MTTDLEIPDRPIDLIEPFRAPHLDPERARAQTRALSALDGGQVEGLTLSARVDEGPDAADWVILSTDAGLVQVSPCVVDGRPVVSDLQSDDAVALVSVVSSIEPLFRAIEDRGGGDLDPVGVGSVPAADGVRLLLEARDTSGTVIHAARFIIAEPIALALKAEGPGRDHPDLPVAVDVAVDGPVLSGRAVLDLGVGDWLLLGPGPRPARLTALSHTLRSAGSLDLATARFIRSTQVASMTETAIDPLPTDPSPDGLTPEAVAVPVTVAFEPVAVPLGRLQGLQPGAVLALDALPETLAVTLSSAGRAFARGRLVSLGQSHAVVIDTLHKDD